jgi:hypothetical protein
MTVYVITNVESGWDCVRGVFQKKSDAFEHILQDSYNDKLSETELEKLVDDTPNIIHTEQLN